MYLGICYYTVVTNTINPKATVIGFPFAGNRKNTLGVRTKIIIYKIKNVTSMDIHP